MIAQPAVPASTVTCTNASGQTAYVTIIGGTVTSVNVATVQVATTSNYMATVPAGATIAVTYSVVPAWYWSTFTPAIPATTVPLMNNTGTDISVVLGAGTVTHVNVNGTDRATSSPSVVGLPNGVPITLTYSVAPVWSWLNFLNLDLLDSLGSAYASNNLIAATGVAGYDPINSLPYAVHAEGGMAGLAAGVSN